MQSTRSNLQVKLISDARKLLERVRTEEGDAPSFDSSVSSEHSSKVLKKPEYPSAPKFHDIVIIRKSKSEEESDQESVGALSFSQEVDAYLKNLSPMNSNGPGSPIPALVNTSFASSVSNGELPMNKVIHAHNSHSDSDTGTGKSLKKEKDCGLDNVSKPIGEENKMEGSGDEAKRNNGSASSASTIHLSVNPIRKKIILNNKIVDTRRVVSQNDPVSPVSESESEDNDAIRDSESSQYVRSNYENAMKSLVDDNELSFSSSENCDITAEDKNKSDTISDQISTPDVARNASRDILISKEQVQVNSKRTSVDDDQTDDKATQIEKLKEQNVRLMEENEYLQNDMNSFDEKLACLEVTLGIIDIVEKNSAEFNSQVESDDEDEDFDQEEDSVVSADTDSKQGNISNENINLISTSQPRTSTPSPKQETSSDSCASYKSKSSRKSSKSSGSSRRRGLFSKCQSKKKRSALQERIDSEQISHQGVIAHKHTSPQKETRSVGSAASNKTSKSNRVSGVPSRGSKPNVLVQSSSKEGDKENLESDNKSYQSAISSVSAASKDSVSSYGSAKSRHTHGSRKSGVIPSSGPMGLASIGEDHPSAARPEERDDQPSISKVRSSSISSKNSLSSANSSLSKREKKELKLLRENNEKMMIAIKALSKATTIQARKHYHYKRKFGHTMKTLEEGNEKMSQLADEKMEQQSKFYEARANFLEEQDKREELSCSVQSLSKKANFLRRQLTAEEQTKMTILEKIDETSISSTSTYSRPSLVHAHSISIDSLDCILSPVSGNDPGKPPLHDQNFEDDLKSLQSKLTLELEVANLKGKLDKKQKKIDRLEKKVNLVKGFLKTKEESLKKGGEKAVAE